MAKLSELAQHDYLRLLVYGESGTGKTCFAAGFPGPIEYWDFDNKISSAAKFFSDKPELLNNIEVKQYAHLPRETRLAAWETRSREIDKLRSQGSALPFKTLVLDSLTTFTHYMLEDYIYRSQRGIKRALPDINAMQDYQLLDKHLTQIITGLLSLNAHVVFIGHMGIEKDETTGSITRLPLMAGKFAQKLPIYFEEVYISKVDASGKYILQTQSDATYKCRSQRKLTKEIPTSYASLGVKNGN